MNYSIRFSTLLRRKPRAVHLGTLALLISVSSSFAVFLSDPFTADPAHIEEGWVGSPAFSGKPYTSAAIGGTNQPQVLTGAGVTLPTDANLGVTSASSNGSGAFLTSGGNIYSPTETLILTLSTGVSSPTAPYRSVLFQIRTIGNPLDVSNVKLTSSAGTFSALYAMNTPGPNGAVDYAFQYDLSGSGGATTFSIAIPGSAPSVSFGYAQLDAGSVARSATALVPEPSTSVAVVAGLGLLSVVALRRRSIA